MSATCLYLPKSLQVGTVDQEPVSVHVTELGPRIPGRHPTLTSVPAWDCGSNVHMFTVRAAEKNRNNYF